jgi:hypothetical protein
MALSASTVMSLANWYKGGRRNECVEAEIEIDGISKSIPRYRTQVANPATCSGLPLTTNQTKRVIYDVSTLG